MANNRKIEKKRERKQKILQTSSHNLFCSVQNESFWFTIGECFWIFVEKKIFFFIFLFYLVIVSYWSTRIRNLFSLLVIYSFAIFVSFKWLLHSMAECKDFKRDNTIFLLLLLLSLSSLAFVAEFLIFQRVYVACAVIKFPRNENGYECVCLNWNTFTIILFFSSFFSSCHWISTSKAN